MTENPDSKDLKTLWKTQKEEQPMVSVEEVRARVRNYHARVRKEGMVAAILSLVMLAICAGIWLTGHPARGVVGVLGLAALSGLFWEIVASYRTRDTLWPWLPKGAMTGDVPATSVEFYRVHLELHRKHWWMNYLDVFFMGPLLVFSFFHLQGQIPGYFYVLAAILMVATIRVRQSKTRRINLEIEALDYTEQGKKK